MGVSVHVVLVETVSNQAYVFQTDKLREIVGASDLIHRAGTRWAIEAAEKAGGPQAPKDQTTTARAAWLAKAPRFGGEPDVTVEPVVCTSGKAVFLVRDRAIGEAIVHGVTRRALEEAPGLVLRGAVSAAIDLDACAKTAGEAVADLFRAIERLRLTLPPAEARFPLQPIVEPCRSSGLPAEGREGGEPLSGPSLVKRRAFDGRVRSGGERQDGDGGAVARIQADLDDPGIASGLAPVPLALNPDELEREMDLGWLAVVHADGNGFGQVFMDLAAFCPDRDGRKATARDYFDLYRDLSVSLDLVGLAALRRAAVALGTRRVARRIKEEDGRRRTEWAEIAPLVVNVMGGDDLTVICDGRRAIEFARAYLEAFEDLVRTGKIAGRTNVIPALRHADGKGRSFGAAAGVAIVKPHHPLHRAYELAEELTTSAKGLVKPQKGALPGLSALDFHVVYGDTTSDLDGLRAGWSEAGADGKPTTLAHARPYATSRTDRHAGAGPDAKAFLDRRHVDRLTTAAAEIAKRDGEGRHLLPRKQQHELRDAVLAGRAVADARLKLVAGRYAKIDWTVFGGGARTLYLDDGGTARTRLVDAMDLADLGAADLGAAEGRAAATEGAEA